MPNNNPTKPLELSKSILPDVKNMIKQYIYDDENNIRRISDPKKKAAEQTRHDAETSILNRLSGKIVIAERCTNSDQVSINISLEEAQLFNTVLSD